MTDTGHTKSRPGLTGWGCTEAVVDELLERAAAGRLPPCAVAGHRFLPNGPTGRGPALVGPLDGKAALLKMHRRGGLFGRLLGLLPGDAAGLFFGAARLRHTVETAHRFRARGGATPEPVGWLATGRGLWRRLYSATAFRADAVTLDQPLSRMKNGSRRALLAATAGAVARWHAAGLLHPDLNVGNILVRRPWQQGRVTSQALEVVDLDRATLASRPGTGARAAALARLERSVLKTLGQQALSRPDRLRFIVAYGREQSRLEGKTPPEADTLIRTLLGPLRWRRLFFLFHGLRP